MKKVLIFDKGDVLSNSGGPLGYMWNIKSGLEQFAIRDPQIYFYSDLKLDKDPKSYRNLFYRVIVSLVRRFLLLIGCPVAARLVGTFFSQGSFTKYEESVIKTFDYVHFHHLGQAMAYIHLVKKLGVKTIFTTHVPEPTVDEIFHLSTFFNKYSVSGNKFRDFFIRKEIEVLEQTDYIMFPVNDVLECYTTKSKDLSDFYSRRDVLKKIFYVPTCIIDYVDSSNIVLDIRSKYNIPNSAKIICYVGRHNHVKGYDYLKSIASILLAEDSNLYFIIGGKQQSIPALNHDRWIELGWVDTKSLLKEIDVFILPNKQTYFDIITLEILRAGVPLVTTLTGGNKYFESLNNGGILFISNNNPVESASLIRDFVYSDLDNKGKSNRTLFETNFSIGHYITNYKLHIDQLDN